MKTKYTWIGVVAVIIIAVIVLAASKGSEGPVSGAADKGPVKIGAVLSLTGAAAPWGEYGKRGMDLAVKTINASGGLNGRQVELITEDDHTDGKQGVSAFNKLVDIDHVQGIIGGVFDFTAQPLMPLALNDKLAFISPSNFQITGGFDLNEQSFVMLTDFNKTILKLQPYLASSTIKKLAVVHYKSTFGTEIAKTLDGAMRGLGRGGIVDESYPQIGGNDWKTIILKLKSQGVDAVFLDMLADDPLNFLRQAKQLGFTPTVITYNGALDSFANETDKSLLNNVVILNWEVVTPAFASLYQKEYGVLPTKSADKYFEAVYVMAQALADSADSSQAAAYIAGHSFETPNGTVSFAADHAVLDTKVEIQVMKGGVLQAWK